jgi:NAD(P)-dependent dehydrogenase (short-subunit alcohol dehydrogenase family)
MVKTFNLDNKIIIITGGYGFLGKSIVESLLFHGAIVIVIGRDKTKFANVFKNKHSNIYFHKCDVSDSNDIKLAFNKIFTKYKKIDVLINNAFSTIGNLPEKISDNEWVFGINGTLNSVFWCIREIIPYFKKQSYGKIINVSSMYGFNAPQFDIYENSSNFISSPQYGAAKAGIIQLTKYYASYLGIFGINVNVISPGPFPSEIVQEDYFFIDKLKSKTSLNRIGKPEDLAGSFIFLSSNASDFITGQNIIIDGGWTIK